VSDGVAIVKRRCTVCRHPQVEAIDLALSASSPSAVAAQFGVGVSSLERHKAKHLRPALAKVAEKREYVTASAIVDRLEDLLIRANQNLDLAEAKGNTRDRSLAIREVRATLETIGKVLGEFRDETPRTDNRQLHVHLEKLTTNELKAIAASVMP